MLSFAGCMLQAQQAPAPAMVTPGGVSTLTTPAAWPDLSMPVAQLKPQQIQTMQQRLSDWPLLAAYREENSKLGPPAAGEQRVVFLGDSITDGWGRRHGKFFPDRPWVNRGISGQTTPQMLLRFQQDVLALQPQAVVLLAGVNDIAGNTGAETLEAIKDNFRSMVALAKQAHVRMVLCSTLPTGTIPWHPGIDPRAEITALNTWLQTYAKEQHVSYLNYYDAMATPEGSMRPGLSVDGLHPNDAGYAVMEPLARKVVTAALALPRP